MADVFFNSPLVTILIPCCNEKESVLDRSLKSCSRIEYNNFKIILIENSISSNIKYSNIQMAKKYDVDIISMENKGSKASALNYAINRVESDFFVIIDADQNIISSTLIILLNEILNYGKEVACVQTAQCFANSSRNTCQVSN